MNNLLGQKQVDIAVSCLCNIPYGKPCPAKTDLMCSPGVMRKALSKKGAEAILASAPFSFEAHYLEAQ